MPCLCPFLRLLPFRDAQEGKVSPDGKGHESRAGEGLRLSEEVIRPLRRLGRVAQRPEPPRTKVSAYISVVRIPCGRTCKP